MVSSITKLICATSTLGFSEAVLILFEANASGNQCDPDGNCAKATKSSFPRDSAVVVGLEIVATVLACLAIVAIVNGYTHYKHYKKWELQRSPEGRLGQHLVHRLEANDMKEILISTRPSFEGQFNVSVTFLLKQILEFDEKEQTFRAMWYKKFVWNNYLLTWRPEDYEGVKRIRFPLSQLWVPDIILFDGIMSESPGSKTDKYVELLNDGTITMYEPVIYMITCEVDMRQFPYDSQVCSMSWGSWEFTKFLLKMTSPVDVIDTSTYIHDQVWLLEWSKITFQEELVTGNEIYEMIIYTFRLTRNPTFYFKMILIPTFLLSLLMYAVYWIPPTRPDRTTVGMSVFAGFMLLLLLVVNIAPASSDVNIGRYYCATIIMVVYSIIFSGVVVALASKEVEMPGKMRYVLVELLGISMGLYEQYDYMMRFNLTDFFTTGTTDMLMDIGKLPSKYDHIEIEMDELSPAVRKRLLCRRDWQVAAVVMDRIMFVLFVFTNCASLFTFFPWPADGNLVWITKGIEDPGAMKMHKH